jgi:hypothetical protein
LEFHAYTCTMVIIVLSPRNPNPKSNQAAQKSKSTSRTPPHLHAPGIPVRVTPPNQPLASVVNLTCHTSRSDASFRKSLSPPVRRAVFRSSRARWRDTPHAGSRSRRRRRQRRLGHRRQQRSEEEDGKKICCQNQVGVGVALPSHPPMKCRGMRQWFV